ncbi:MAG: NAD(P)-dependent alcohol dehydrogenase [Deltaproteobacteria bacterium]|nr:NAD(P)-dependent alcohol dehydrogenase [Deltaproteobacteria bacterium]
MKAVVQQGYGSLDLLELREVEKPTPGDGEVLVRVHAASVHPDVWHVVSGRPHVLRLMGAGFFKPKNPIPGTDMAGVVEAVGQDVKQFQPGDEVFGETIGSMQWINGGAYAEYVAVAEERLALKPANVTFEQAASVPTSGYIALLNFGESTQVSPGQEVLVNGAGGGVGALALQLAKAHGARVTAVDSTKKLGLLRDLGADEVIDYTREDFTKRGVRYDLIFDIPGNHPFSECRRALTPEGTYILIGHERFGESGKRVLGLIPHFFKLMFLSLFVKQLPKPNFSMPSKKDTMTVLRELLEAGKITPVIDRTYSLGEASEAIHYLMHGEPPGRVVITP